MDLKIESWEETLNYLRRASTLLISAAIATLMTAGLSFAKDNSINVLYKSKVGTEALLKPGKYRVNLVQGANSTKLDFYRNDHQVAQVPVTIKPENRNNQYTEVDYNQLTKNAHAITAIRLKGWSEEFVMPSLSSATAKPAGSAATKAAS
jgi:hypothetical protein